MKQLARVNYTAVVKYMKFSVRRSPWPFKKCWAAEVQKGDGWTKFFD
jgi:hypothetical protein